MNRCAGSLGDAGLALLFPDHPTLQVQAEILVSLSSGWVADGMYTGSPVPASVFIADLAALGRRILGYGDPLELAQRIPEVLDIPGSADSTIVWRRGVTAESSASSIAIATTAAWLILAAPSTCEAGNRLRWLVASSRRKGLSVRATSLGWGRGVSAALVAAQLSALRPFLFPSDHLRFRLHSTSPRPAVRGLAEQRAACIPSMLWLDWSLPLRCSGVGNVQSRSALSVAVLLVGSTITIANAAALLGSVTDAPAVSRVLQRWSGSTESARLFGGITDLAEVLDHSVALIDYARRRTLDCFDLLPERSWKRICLEVGIAPGRGLRHRLVQSWLYERLTGLPAKTRPWFDNSPSFRTHLANIPLWLTAEVIAAVDCYAKTYLDVRGIDNEPVTWCPEVRLAARPLPNLLHRGLDIEGLHESLRSRRHRSFGLLAKSFGIDTEVLRHIVATNPAGVPNITRIASAAKILPRAQLMELYLERGISLSAIAASADVSRQMVTRLATHYRVPLRDPGRRRNSFN